MREVVPDVSRLWLLLWHHFRGTIFVWFRYHFGVISAQNQRGKQSKNAVLLGKRHDNQILKVHIL